MKNYLERMLIAQRRYPSLFPVGVSDAAIKHDHWCSLLVREGACDCRPEIIVTSSVGHFYVLADGSVALISKN